VIAAATEYLQKGQVKYTAVAGLPELRDAVAAKVGAATGQTFARDEVIITCGVKHGLYAGLQVLCNPGDEVVFASPYWLSYPEMARLAGARPVSVPTRAENGFALDPAALEAALTPRTRVLILNSPCNPTGAVMDAAHLEAVVRVAARHDLWIFSDEIYDKLVYDGARAVGPLNLPAAVQARTRERTILFNGVSKTYSMTGWRIGYAVGPAAVIQAMETLQSHETANPNTLAQVAALAAITSDQAVVESNRVQFDARRRLICKLIAELPGWVCPEPKGAFYAFPDVSALYGKSTPAGGRIGGSMDLATRLLDEAHVATVPGVVFGDDRHLRLSYATSAAQIEAGMRRIADFVAALA
jgi:aspartate aminotransferase